MSDECPFGAYPGYNDHMRFDQSSASSAALNWRWFLWATSLVPLLLLMGMMIRQAHRSKLDPVLAGQSPEDAKRLQRILHEPAERSVSPLRHDALRIVTTAEHSQPVSRDDDHSAGQGGGDTQARAVVSPSVQLDKSLLAAVEDNTFGVTNAEKDTYDTVLATARDTSQADLERIARKDIPFAVLMLDAHRYRGEVLTVEGDLRRLHHFASPPNVQGVTEYYEAWLFTSDSGLNPYRIICTSLPESLSSSFGDQLDPPVRVRATGYFFKRYSYATDDDFHTAPLLLAKTLTLLGQPAPKLANVGSGRSQTLTIIAFGVLAGFAVVWLAIEVGKRRSLCVTSSDSSSKDSPETPDFGWLDKPPR